VALNERQQIVSMATDRTAPHLDRARSAAALAIPGVLALTVPMVGFLTSLLLPFVAARVGPRLWPQTSPIVRHLCAALALIGLWLPALVAWISLGRLGSEATTWLIIPLCAPVGAALLVPATFGALSYLIGIAVGSIARSPWPWVLGAWAAPLTYSAATRWLVDFSCVA
jgi:hypothetical protein